MRNASLEKYDTFIGEEVKPSFFAFDSISLSLSSATSLFAKIILSADIEKRGVRMEHKRL